jgi:hypothetical protein
LICRIQSGFAILFFFFLLCTKTPNIISVHVLENIFNNSFFTTENNYTQAGMDEA